MTDIIGRFKNWYKNGSVLTKLLLINITVFLVLKIISIIFVLFKIYWIDLITFLGVPSQPNLLVRRIWTLFTYMFVHEGFLHILFNMLWLYFFGKIFLQFFTARTLGSLYVLGGLAGAILYIVAFNTIPYYVDMGRGWMIGASASVIAIVMGVSFYAPDYRLNLLFLGRIKLIYIALFAFILDFLSLSSPVNPGGHVAHIGGAILGIVFASQYNKGRDITRWMSRVIDFFVDLFSPRKRTKFGKRSKMKVYQSTRESDWDYNQRKHKEQEEIDAILDKIKETGYSGLTEEEKRKLFESSKK